MSSSVLKLIACITMLFDHIGYLMQMYNFGNGEIADIFRIVGRASFPIFAFLIAEGFKHTKNHIRYAARLLIAAIISEVPYDLCFHRSHTYPGLNVMYTLLFALLSLIFADMCVKNSDKKLRILFVLPPLSAAFIAENLKTDYAFWGIILIFILYLVDADSVKRKFLLIPAVLIFSARYYIDSYIDGAAVSSWGENQIWALTALIPLFLYNGKRGLSGQSKTVRKAEQYFFYLFYPAHLLILYYVFPLIVKA